MTSTSSSKPMARALRDIGKRAMELEQSEFTKEFANGVAASPPATYTKLLRAFIGVVMKLRESAAPGESRDLARFLSDAIAGSVSKDGSCENKDNVKTCPALYYQDVILAILKTQPHGTLIISIEDLNNAKGEIIFEAVTDPLGNSFVAVFDGSSEEGVVC